MKNIHFSLKFLKLYVAEYEKVAGYKSYIRCGENLTFALNIFICHLKRNHPLADEQVMLLLTPLRHAAEWTDCREMQFTLSTYKELSPQFIEKNSNIAVISK